MEKIIGLTLKTLRKEANLTQEQLAFNSDLDRTYISLLERGLRVPTIITVFKLSEALNIPPEEFIKLVRISYENNTPKSINR